MVTPEMARAIREAALSEDDDALAEALTSAVYACIDEDTPDTEPAKPKGKPKLGTIGAESDDD